MSNLKLWKSVQETDTRYTKPAKKGQYNFTSIAPMSQFKKATEVFGIQGIGWGVVVGSEKFTEQHINTTILLSYDAVMFFIYDGVRGEIPIHATEKQSYQTQGANGYLKIDDEVRKKVVTNAKTKGLSELGFNADIFMGQFDDPNYVEYIKYSQSIEQAENQEEEINKKISELNSWCDKELTVYGSINDKRTLDLILVQHKNKLQGKCGLLRIDSTSYMQAFDEAYNNQLSTIKV